ncbi:unnamed protein product [Musa acuminata subsp. malaccensis]|uniref:Inositol oxygenase n=1 Tax=Musa acuminata subsp. malaccensis TaxID=214687 RepID=A0A804JTY1_MUSAM|nr:unnamed protein product [Musa acuminata subsp. malaccensis]
MLCFVPLVAAVTGEVKRIPSDPKELLMDGGFMVPDANSFGHTFRDYNAESERQKTVEEFYRMNHIHQTCDFMKRMREEYGKLDSIWGCIELLNEFVDESDPDLDEPQIEHLLQTAETIRKDYPEEDWLHLTALIYDLGRCFSILALGNFHNGLLLVTHFLLDVLSMNAMFTTSILQKTLITLILNTIPCSEFIQRGVDLTLY